MKTLNEIKQIEKEMKIDSQKQLKELLIFLIKHDEAKVIRENDKYTYYVTTKGEVYSYTKSTKHIKKLKKFIDGKYYKVHINKKNERVHRLVKQAFDPDYHKYEQVNHIDKNSLNNNIDNLEMCTLLENVAHQYMSDKLSSWRVSIKDMRVAETIAADKKI
ncbi:HNH endonuclease (plasmid) [Macrococcoides bohemicum]|uniref:HNH endonuclease n=1 Tax=Macrococcoides bohemicum TaxID=1903056 RepID=UPI003B00950C